jgi:hypothetical protein
MERSYNASFKRLAEGFGLTFDRLLAIVRDQAPKRPRGPFLGKIAANTLF